MRRLPDGGAIDRHRPLRFTWDGTPLVGFAGDSLASALLGAGADVIGRSVSLGRPRGITSAGFEEASGFGQVVSGGAPEPLVRLSAQTLYEGLAAESRNTRGVLASSLDRGRFDKRHVHCDVLVVGGGPTGLAAAVTTAQSGARTILVEADPQLGGALWRDADDVEGSAGLTWVSRLRQALRECPDVRVLTNATAMSTQDQLGMVVVQRVGAQRPAAERDGVPEQRLWYVRARTIVLATGMLERPIVHANNDRPGILLSTAARLYLERYALAPRRGVVFTTCDDGYRTALAWMRHGVDVGAIVDARRAAGGTWPARAASAGVRVMPNAVVVDTEGDASGRLTTVTVRSARGTERLAADVLAVSGGFEPAIGLYTQRRGVTTYDRWWGAAVPTRTATELCCAGGAAGVAGLGSCLADGVRAAVECLGTLGVRVVDASVPVATDPVEAEPAQLWHVPAADGDESPSFVDLHRDVTMAGVRRAVGAGLTHIEHIKRYSLIGTGVEQGRSATVNAGVLAAALMDRPVPDVGLAGTRPPVEPIVFHVLGGGARGERLLPVRRTSLHAEHERLGATFEPAGLWMRARTYPRAGERDADAVRRECHAVRTGVGVMDASTLGKVDVRGPDATWFLEQLYASNIASIGVGRARYSVMCRMDGALLDDGVVMRLAPEHYYVTTSTGHADAVVDWMEEWLQTEWPQRRVWITPITEQYATLVLAGPASRRLLSAVAPQIDASAETFPFLAVRRGTVAGIDAQVARVSFSGELAYEVTVPWFDAPLVWRETLHAGAPLGVTPYGLEALQTLRMEKGYIVVGQDTEALTTPHDAGLGWMVSTRKSFVGQRSLQRAVCQRDDRLQLVGFVPAEGSDVLPEGAALTGAVHEPPMRLEGHVTSSRWSETLNSAVGLALVRGGRGRLGETLYAPLAGRVVSVTLVAPAHYDPEGRKRDG